MRSRFLVAFGLTIAAPLVMAQSTPPPARPVATAEMPAFTPAIGKEAVTKLAEEIESSFVFPDVATRYAARLRERLAAGAYDAPADAAALAQLVTADLQAVAPDGHLRMHPPRDTRAAGSTGGPPREYPPLMEQAGMIAPGIAYVRFNAFMGTPEVLKDFTAFLDANQGAKVLIIDARTHAGGGLDEMDILFPRIFTKAQTVMVMDTRASVAGSEAGGASPTLVKVDAPPQFHREEHRVTPASPMSPWAKAKIYYLTAGRTASAAEHLATVFKATRRATLVGDVTAGAGHYGRRYSLPGGFSAFIPFGRSYYPGGDGWEQVGVAPDIAVAPERALYTVLVREGVPAAQAEALSASHMPSASMARRQPRPR